MSGTGITSAPAAGKPAHAPQHQEYVTMRIDGQLFGIPVLKVQDVLRGLKITHVPLAPAEIIGAMNLRGRIVTVIDMRRCLGLAPVSRPAPAHKIMNVVLEHKNEYLSLIVDSVGEVINLAGEIMQENPSNLSQQWKALCSGVYKLQDELLVILDVQKLLKF